MRQSTTLFVGLDAHKDSVDIALADAKRDAPVRHLATVVDMRCYVGLVERRAR